MACFGHCLVQIHPSRFYQITATGKGWIAATRGRRQGVKENKAQAPVGSRHRLIQPVSNDPRRPQSASRSRYRSSVIIRRDSCTSARSQTSRRRTRPRTFRQDRMEFRTTSDSHVSRVPSKSEITPQIRIQAQKHGNKPKDSPDENPMVPAIQAAEFGWHGIGILTSVNSSRHHLIQPISNDPRRPQPAQLGNQFAAPIRFLDDHFHVTTPRRVGQFVDGRGFFPPSAARRISGSLTWNIHLEAKPSAGRRWAPLSSIARSSILGAFDRIAPPRGVADQRRVMLVRSVSMTRSLLPRRLEAGRVSVTSTIASTRRALDFRSRFN